MTYVERLLVNFREKGILFDANLLLLYLVGRFQPRLIGDGKYNKLSKYTIEDYDILVRLKSLFRRAVTTSHVLTEVSNLTGDLPEATKQACFIQFETSFEEVEELFLSSHAVAARSDFRFLGLTDAALSQLSNSFLVVSDDARMISFLEKAGQEALNFNHLRGHLFVAGSERRSSFS